MSSFKDIVNKYAAAEMTVPSNPDFPAGTDFSLGSEDENEAPVTKRKKRPALDKENLRKDLDKIKNDNSRYFMICVLMVIILFIASLIVVLTNLERPTLITAVQTGFGISTAGLIWLMIKLWREKTSTEFLLALAIVDGETLKTVVDALAARMARK